MTSSWPRVSLGDHVDLLTGFPFESAQFTDDPQDLRLVKGVNVGQGDLRWDRTDYWPMAERSEYAKYELEIGDVVLAMDRPWVEAGLKQGVVTERDLPALLLQRVARLRGANGLSTGFLRYLISSQAFSNYIQPIVTGVNVPHISPDQIRGFTFHLPPKPVQGRVAAVLVAYDELIENNLRRIQILEEMAQAVYREWFVNFRFSGHEDVALVDSPLGPMPEGWEVAMVSDAVELNPRVRLPRDQEIRFVPMGSLIEGSMVIDGHETRIGPSGSQFQNGDTLLARITPSLENGKTGFVQFLSENEVACGSTEFIVMRSQTLTPEFVYLLARTDDFRGVAVNSMVGASGRQRVQENSIARYPFPHPDSSTLQRFHEMTSPMFRMVQSLVEQNANLRSTRDLLLPKLVSGQIDVSDLDIATEWLAS